MSSNKRSANDKSSQPVLNPAADRVAHMKWWGWGVEGVAFEHRDKPSFAPFVKKHIGLDLNKKSHNGIDFSSLDVPATNAPKSFLQSVAGIVGGDNCVTSDLDRVVHAYGKSVRDLLRIRSNDLGRIPDVVVYPADENEVRQLMDLVVANDAVLIPFGGGSNIAGSLESNRDEARSVVSLDMGRMNKVLSIDDESRIAQVQAGALGPDLEKQLNDRGWTLGHFPDSFNHSTLGGWIATRSSGMQSDKYGDIADLTRALRVVMPNGSLHTRPVPSQSTGPSVREMLIGSEGRLGVITEATVHVHRIPKNRVILAYLFKSFDDGLRAMAEIAESDASPSITRVSDASETAFSFATTKKQGFKSKAKSKVQQFALTRIKGFDMSKACLSFIGYEGSEAHVEYQKDIVNEIVSKHGGLCAGPGPGVLYDQKKFDTPYIRDFLLDHDAIADVSETAAPWSRLSIVHHNAYQAVNNAMKEVGVRGYIMSHLSHSYHGGACLYFTFAIVAPDPATRLEKYDAVKQAIQQSFIDSGATLSHHHGVGVEHKQWLPEDISPAGVDLMQTLFDGVDPKGNLNPGKITGR